MLGKVEQLTLLVGYARAFASLCGSAERAKAIPCPRAVLERLCLPRVGSWIQPRFCDLQICFDDVCILCQNVECIAKMLNLCCIIVEKQLCAWILHTFFAVFDDQKGRGLVAAMCMSIAQIAPKCSCGHIP